MSSFEDESSLDRLMSDYCLEGNAFDDGFADGFVFSSSNTPPQVSSSNSIELSLLNLGILTSLIFGYY